MSHETVKVILEQSYPYSDFQGWYDSLDQYEKEVWSHIAKDSGRSERNVELLTKKAMELYCLEMDIDYVPNSENYLETIYKRLISNLTLVSMLERGLIELTSGKLSFLYDAKFALTEKGKKYVK